MRRLYSNFIFILLISLSLNVKAKPFEIVIQNAPYLKELIEANFKSSKGKVKVSGGSVNQIGPLIYLYDPTGKKNPEEIHLDKDTNPMDILDVLSSYVPMRTTSPLKSQKKKYEEELEKRIRIVIDRLKDINYTSYSKQACSLKEEEEFIPKVVAVDPNKIETHKNLGTRLADDALDSAAKLSFESEFGSDGAYGLRLERKTKRLKNGAFQIDERLSLPIEFIKNIPITGLGGAYGGVKTDVSIRRSYVLSAKEIGLLPKTDSARREVESNLLGIRGARTVYRDFADAVKDQIKVQETFKVEGKKLAASILPTGKQMHRMKEGEVREYAVRGTILAGAEIGRDLVGISSFNAGGPRVGKAWQVHGTHTFKIERLPSTKGKSIEISLGNSGGLGSSFYVNGDILNPKVEIGPLRFRPKFFKVSAFDRQKSTQLTRGRTSKFRVDPSSKDGQKALFFIKRGRLDLLMKLSLKSRDVDYLQYERARVATDNEKTGSKLGFIVGYSAKSQKQTKRKRVYNNTGESISESRTVKGTDKKTKTTFGKKESVKRDYSVVSNSNLAYDTPQKLDVGITLSKEYSDPSTNAKEVKQYFSEVYDDIGVGIQRTSMPYRDSDNRRINYGSVDYRTDLYIPPKTVDKFLKASDSQMWSSVEKVFGVPSGSWSTPAARKKARRKSLAKKVLKSPLTLIGGKLKYGGRYKEAADIVENWKRARDTQSVELKIRSLGNIFDNNLYKKESKDLLKLRASGENISIKVTGGNYQLGKVNIVKNKKIDHYNDRHEDLSHIPKAIVEKKRAPEIKFIKLKGIELKGRNIRFVFQSNTRPQTVTVKMRYRINKTMQILSSVKTLGNGFYEVTTTNERWMKDFKKDKFNGITISAITVGQGKYEAEDKRRIKTSKYGVVTIKN